MALIMQRRTPFTVEDPYRKMRPKTSKILFLACEGSATEEEYVEILSQIFARVKSKIQVISVAEDEVHTKPKGRTKEQNQILGKCKPWQLVERIDKFKKEKETVFEFSRYPEDEFWVLADIDDNIQNHLKEFQQTFLDCESKGYHYAFSNPFFELWLLLHHDAVTEEDRSYAVTEEHTYEATDHFRKRLEELGVPLKDKKHLTMKDYTEEKIQLAVKRAKNLQNNETENYPSDLGTHIPCCSACSC